MIRPAAEIALQLEGLQLEPIVGQHVPGLLSRIADQLSRLHQGAPMPLELQQQIKFHLPQSSTSELGRHTDVKVSGATS